jgi:hypothetical protein
MSAFWWIQVGSDVSKPILDIPPSVDGLKDWLEQRFGFRPGWPSHISTTYSPNGEIDLTLEIKCRLRQYTEIEALQMLASYEALQRQQK